MVAREIPNLKVSGSIPLFLIFANFLIFYISSKSFFLILGTSFVCLLSLCIILVIGMKLCLVTLLHQKLANDWEFNT